MKYKYDLVFMWLATILALVFQFHYHDDLTTAFLLVVAAIFSAERTIKLHIDQTFKGDTDGD